MYTVILVGQTVVGAFATDAGKTRCINALAPGCRPKVKKYPRTYDSPWAKERIRSEARQQHIKLLKPGEFLL